MNLRSICEAYASGQETVSHKFNRSKIVSAVYVVSDLFFQQKASVKVPSWLLYDFQVDTFFKIWKCMVFWPQSSNRDKHVLLAPLLL